MLLIYIAFLFNFFNILTATCPNGSISYSHNPSKCYFFEALKFSWSIADQNCNLKGGNLVSIHDMFENMFISGEANIQFTDDNFWIGANNIQSINTWQWTDNTTTDFFDWDKGQPPNAAPGPLCVSSMKNGAKWSAVDCFITKPYVCEVEAKICSEGWTYYKNTNFCYKVIRKQVTWSNAVTLCEKEDAHLVSLHSYDEALFVTSLASNITFRENTCNDYDQMWIGLSTPDNNTTWEWTDGTSFNYENWGMEEPDRPGIQNCVVMWISQPCDFGWNAAPTEWDNLQCYVKIINNVCKKAVNT